RGGGDGGGRRRGCGLRLGDRLLEGSEGGGVDGAGRRDAEGLLEGFQRAGEGQHRLHGRGLRVHRRGRRSLGRRGDLLVERERGGLVHQTGRRQPGGG